MTEAPAADVAAGNFNLRLSTMMAAAATGFAAVITQLVMMRELVTAFSGNELILGVSLSAWLLLTGLGAWLGRVVCAANPLRCSQPEVTRLAGVILAGIVLVAVLPFGEVTAIRGLRDVVFPRGAAVGIGATGVGCMVALAPFCLISGALLTLTSVVLSALTASAAVGRVYVADALGSVAGGVLFSLILAPRLDHFAILGVASAVALAAGAVLAVKLRRKVAVWGIVAVAALLVTGLSLNDWDGLTSRWQYREQVALQTTSPYGRLLVTMRAGQLTFHENGVPLIYSQNAAAREEAVHYAMAQRPSARRVLLIGGVVAGAGREILRHSAAWVACLELDPQIIAAGRRLLPENLADPRLRVISGDGRRFVQTTREKFDVVILDLPEPVTLQLNRYFTAEFFAEVKRVLAAGGVLGFGLGRYENFIGAELAAVLASTDATLRRAFAHVMAVPGGRVYHLASDGPLDPDIATALEAGGLRLEWINRHYLDAMLTPDRWADLQRAAAGRGEVNRDFAPVLFYREIRHWLGQFGTPGLAVTGMLLLTVAGYFALLPAVPRVLFASGFAASGLEVVLLLAFQIYYGAVYQQLGLVIAVFMAGLALGAHFMEVRPRQPARAARQVAGLGFATAAVAALLMLLPQLRVVNESSGSGWAVQAVMLVLTAAVGAVVGGQFPPAGAACREGSAIIAARLFGADLLGAAAGALLVGAWLVPTLGTSAVCAVIAGLNAVAAALLWWRTVRAA